MSESKHTVLIVEDSPSFAATVEAAILDRYDYEVVIMDSFSKLKEQFSEFRDDVFVAITDLNLPDAEDGAAVKMLSAYDIPCIAFTGNLSSELRSKILSWGVADYVLKKGEQDIDYVVDMVHRIQRNPSINIMVVDDAKSSQAYLYEVLEKQCYKVETVSSGVEALELMDNGYEPRIMLVDLVMNEMDGFELLSEVRKLAGPEKLAVIGVSGFASSEQIAKFMKYGGNDFLVKPFEHEQVACRVNSNAQLLEQFDHLKKLNQQKNDLLGMAAHDIRGPLGVVMSASSMLKNEVITEQGMMLVNLAIKATKSMEELLNSLLDISVIEGTALDLVKDRMNLSALIKELVAEMTIMAEAKGQKLVLDSPVDILWMQGDEARIREVLMNLISNAIKYSPKDAEIEITLSHNQKKVRIQVIDQGEGIPEQECNLLFQPFAQISTKPTADERSIGLGLAICKKIIDKHKGKISYQPNGKQGSIFEVSLPIG